MKNLLLAAVGTLTLASCTGDPSAGGLFWSPSMSNERIAARESDYHSIRKDTASKNAEARRIQNQMNR